MRSEKKYSFSARHNYNTVIPVFPLKIIIIIIIIFSHEFITESDIWTKFNVWKKIFRD
jgi:hypothetical protein